MSISTKTAYFVSQRSIGAHLGLPGSAPIASAFLVFDHPANALLSLHEAYRPFGLLEACILGAYRPFGLLEAL
jgi:hypothetical protein